MLQWLRRTDPDPDPVYATGVPTGAPDSCLQLVLPTGAPNWGPGEEPSVPARRKRKHIVIERLYPVAKPVAEVHARALLDLVSTECPHLVGRYVPQGDLARTYIELCQSENWEARHWTSVGRELAKITNRRKAKRNGKRFPAYRIPRVA